VALEDVMTRYDLKLGKAQAPVRVAVTGRTVGPPLFEALEVLGRDETLRRLRAARPARGHATSTLLLVTDPYHALRTKLTAQDAGFSWAYVSPTPTSVVTGSTELRRQLAETAGVAARADHRLRPSARV
jgi:hypothetical protein